MIMLPRWGFVLDIETTDTLPTTKVLSIGCVAIDLAQRRICDVFYSLLSFQPQIFRSQSDETMAWWKRQNDRAFFDAFRAESRDTPTKALMGLGNFISMRSEPGDRTVWGYGASFDVVILEDLFRETDVEIPWTYRQHRDLRTLYELAGVKPSDRHWTPDLSQHIARDDAFVEATVMLEAFTVLFGDEPLCGALVADAAEMCAGEAE